MKAEKKHQSLLLKGIVSWSMSIVTTIMETQLSFLHMVTNKMWQQAYIQHPTLSTIDAHVAATYAFHVLKKSNKKVTNFLRKI